MNYDILYQAIQNKQSVEFYYKGHYRVFSPHVLGAKEGQLRVLGYQTGGTSSQGVVKGDWRCIHLNQIQQLRTSTEPFQVGKSKRKRPQTCVDRIHISI